MKYSLNAIGHWVDSLGEWRPLMEAFHIVRNINGMKAALKSVNSLN